MRAALQQMLDAHDPYPGVVLDRRWNVVAANAAATALVAGLPGDLLGPPMNIFRASLRPDGWRGGPATSRSGRPTSSPSSAAWSSRPPTPPSTSS